MILMRNNFAYYQGHEPFVSKIKDDVHLSLSQYRPVVTSFLSPVEWTHLDQLVGNDVYLYLHGGYAYAQRKVAVISPFKVEPDFEMDLLVSDIDTRFRLLSHRDVLGALMHLGLERNRLGDLIVMDTNIVIICKSQVSEFIQNHLHQIGKCPVRFAIQNDMDIQFKGFDEILIHCASFRIDAIVAQLAHCSRAQASIKIKQGFIKVNDIVLEQNRQLCNNDFVSIRKIGRFQFQNVVSTTKKGRLVLRFLKFK